jgi:hypothetical protein
MKVTTAVCSRGALARNARGCGRYARTSHICSSYSSQNLGGRRREREEEKLLRAMKKGGGGTHRWTRGFEKARRKRRHVPAARAALRKSRRERISSATASSPSGKKNSGGSLVVAMSLSEESMLGGCGKQERVRRQVLKRRQSPSFVFFGFFHHFSLSVSQSTVNLSLSVFVFGETEIGRKLLSPPTVFLPEAKHTAVVAHSATARAPPPRSRVIPTS